MVILAVDGFKTQPSISNCGCDCVVAGGCSPQPVASSDVACNLKPLLNQLHNLATRLGFWRNVGMLTLCACNDKFPFFCFGFLLVCNGFVVLRLCKCIVASVFLRV